MYSTPLFLMYSYSPVKKFNSFGLLEKWLPANVDGIPATAGWYHVKKTIPLRWDKFNSRIGIEGAGIVPSLIKYDRGGSKNMTGGSAKKLKCRGASAKKIKCVVGGGPRGFFPVRPPLRISNWIALIANVPEWEKCTKLYLGNVFISIRVTNKFIKFFIDQPSYE